MAINSINSSDKKNNGIRKRVTRVWGWESESKEREREEIRDDEGMVGRYCTRGDERRAAYNQSTEGKTNRDKKVYCVGGDIFCGLLLGIFLERIGTYARDWGSMAAKGGGGLVGVGGSEEKYVNFVEFRSISNMGASCESSRKSGRGSEREEGDRKISDEVYGEAGCRV
jgi:hypothetical protein